MYVSGTDLYTVAHFIITHKIMNVSACPQTTISFVINGAATSRNIWSDRIIRNSELLVGLRQSCNLRFAHIFVMIIDYYNGVKTLLQYATLYIYSIVAVVWK